MTSADRTEGPAEVEPGRYTSDDLDRLAARHRRDEVELGRRAVLPIRIESTGGPRKRAAAIVRRGRFS